MSQEKLYEYQYDEATKELHMIKYVNCPGFELMYRPELEMKYKDILPVLQAGKRDDNTIAASIPRGFETIKSLWTQRSQISEETAVEIIRKVAEAINLLYHIYELNRSEGLGYISADNILYNMEKEEVLLACYEYRKVYYLDEAAQKIDRKRTPTKQDDVEALRKIFQEEMLEVNHIRDVKTRSGKRLFKLLRNHRHASMNDIRKNRKWDVLSTILLIVVTLIAVWIVVPYHVNYIQANRIMETGSYSDPQDFQEALHHLNETKGHRIYQKHQKSSYLYLMELARYQYVETGDMQLMDEIVREIVNGFDNQEALFKQEIRFLRVKAMYHRILWLNEEQGDQDRIVGEINDIIVAAVKEISLLYDGNFDNTELYILWSRFYRTAWQYSVDGTLEDRFKESQIIALNDGLIRFEDNLQLLIEKAYVLGERIQTDETAYAEVVRLKAAIDSEYFRIRDSEEAQPYAYDSRKLVYYDEEYTAFAEWYNHTLTSYGGFHVQI